GLGYLDDRGRVVVASSTQNIHYKMKEISRLLGIPTEEIRVVQATTGGGFGGKLDVTVEGYLALAVWHTKRPVFMRYTREESLLAQTKRHPLYIVYKTGARKDGSLTAVEVNIVGDTGPYNSYGETVCLRAAVHATGPYEVPNVLVNSRMFYTNNPVSGAMRGFGVPQLALAHESQLDEIAGLIGMDPLDIRMKNALKRGSLTATSQALNHSAGLLETLKAVEPFWRERRKEGPGSGFGLGCMYYGIGNTGISNPSSCYLTLTPEGRVEMHSGVCDIGQGSDTVLLQILCDALGMEEMGIDLVRGDTDTSYDAGSTSASRQTYISGMAVCNAAQKLKKYLKEHGHYDGKPLKEIYRDAGDKGVPIFEGHFDPPTTAPDPETSQGAPYATYAFATHMTQVDVDEVTGVCKVIKVHAAHDVGRAINVSSVRGQIYGCVAMGIGLALMEEFIPGKTGSFDNYYLPTSMDMPEVEAMIVEDREPTGPFGAKGVGEPALIPQAAAIVNAIKDATGVRMRQLPCDIERLKLALEKDKENKG
ncbi:MAG TPA: molybdopterin-dependent oxidoreductase, partial [Syntrophorhabdaceae bacterium]|nr:molybdopterin-dependent oxidoreductase [Syntrophorhabdaceae bacterium]